MSKPKVIVTRKWPEAVEDKLAQRLDMVIVIESAPPAANAHINAAAQTIDAGKAADTPPATPEAGK